MRCKVKVRKVYGGILGKWINAQSHWRVWTYLQPQQDVMDAHDPPATQPFIRNVSR